MFYVYELRDSSGRPFYIGKGSKRRMHEHESKARYGRVSPVCDKIRALWQAGQTISKAVVFQSPDEVAAYAEECRLIALYGRASLTNQTAGGCGVRQLTVQARQRIASSRRGKVASDETRRRLRLSHLGKRHTASTKARIAAKQRTIKKPWAVGSRPNLGRGYNGLKWTATHRANFRAKRLGHAVSQVTRDRISATKKAARLAPG